MPKTDLETVSPREFSHVGFTLRGAQGLGDHLIFSSFPENFFSITGHRLIDLDQHWMFDFNPFVLRGPEPFGADERGESLLVLNPRQMELPQSIVIDGFYREVIGSVAERTLAQYGLPAKELVLRHPRLYRFEDEPLQQRVVVHTTGKEEWRRFSPKVMEQILASYSGWPIYQIGLSTDVEFPGALDFRGRDLWEVAKLVAGSAIYIGVDSGPSWIAASYPKVQTKIVLCGADQDSLLHIRPMSIKDNLWHWYDVGRKYFNDTDRDINFTYSFRKL